jgi:hypothetical protein
MKISELQDEQIKQVAREDEQFASDFLEIFGGFPKDQAIALLVRRQAEIRMETFAALREARSVAAPPQEEK